VGYEGQYEPKERSRSGDHTVVEKRSSGRLFPSRYDFDETSGALQYRQESDGRPFVAVETTLDLVPRTDTTEILLRLTVDPTVPLPFLGRYAAWLRRRTLERLCDRLAADLSREQKQVA